MALILRDVNLRVFRGEPLPHVFFQRGSVDPSRFEPWVDWHRQFNSLPPELEGRRQSE